MEKIYLDNAATTPLRKEVVTEITAVLSNHFGNPSSSHSFGRSAKNSMESSRKKIAKLLGTSASEIIFTSSATEGINWILRNAIKDLGVKRIITSPLEHHATLHTVEVLKKEYDVVIEYLPVQKDGTLLLSDLEKLLKEDLVTLVALMHVNNETGEMIDLEYVGQLCKENKAYFQCDAVQSIGKYPFDLSNSNLDFLVGTAHKFHGPKGIGFTYMRKNVVLQPMIYGGEQEKGFRAGTEAVHQIAGMTKALEISYAKLDEEKQYISNLKEYCEAQLNEAFPECTIIGKQTFYNIINVVLPFDKSKTAMLLFSLDMKGISVSRGSACQSGSSKPSHVLAAFLSPEEQQKPNIRISISHCNTKEEIDYLISVLKTI